MFTSSCICFALPTNLIINPDSETDTLATPTPLKWLAYRWLICTIFSRLLVPLATLIAYQVPQVRVVMSWTVWTDSPDMPYSLILLSGKWGLLGPWNNQSVELISVFGIHVVSDIVYFMSLHIKVLQ